uniref:Calcineurin-like phosphoesterase domain-containing protein n=1 Tax=viral metagenome TaxID=1070528 RepID=A0A6C0LTT8_9ZZZZ
MNAQIVSDVHIEYKNNEIVNPLDYIKPSSPILILAGDIGSLYKYDQLYSFLRDISLYFEHVLYVPGNHEYYIPPGFEPLEFDALTTRLVSIENSIDNLKILNRQCVQLGDTCIIGATLWTKPLCELPKYIIRIHDITTDKYTNMFNVDLEYVERAIEYCKEKKLKVVCVTHHPPSEQIDTGKRDKFKSFYMSDLDYLLKDVDTWICGHVHNNFDFITEQGCRIVGNQKGKPKDKITDYRIDLVVEI